MLTLALQDEVQTTADVEELFARYERLKNTGSVEGLSSILSSIVRGLTDLFMNALNNLKTHIMGLFKSVKRSELQAYVGRHSTGYHALKSKAYTEIYKKKVQTYPFNIDPNTFGAYCADTFNILDMRNRLTKVVTEYRLIAASIKTLNLSNMSNHTANLASLNMPSVTAGILSKIQDSIIVHPSSNRTTVGQVFDSVPAIFTAAETSLRSANELDTAVKVGDGLESLYVAFEDVLAALNQADSSMNLTQLKSLPAVLNETGYLLERYAVLIKEYTSLDHFLVDTLMAIS